MYLLAASLDRSAFEPVVLAKKSPGLDEWCERLAGAGISVTRVTMDLRRDPRDAARIFEALRTAAPRVVHVNMPGPYDGQMGLIAPLARAAGAAGVVVTEHLPRVERLWKRALVKRISYAFADRVLTVCRANVPYLVGRQGVPEYKAQAVYNGIPESYGRRREEWRGKMRRLLGLGAAETGLVFVGSLVERKGLGVLLEALGALRSSPWRLAVVGDGERRAEYEALARSRGVDDRVTFLGEIPEADVEKVLSGSDVLVLPSTMEGMPYVVIEAMACSLPVAATRVDGIPEAAPDGESGLLVAPGDADALREALARLIGDEPLRARFGAEGRRRFERLFTLERQIAVMQALYAGLAGDGRVR
ncbi:MAG: glycosyltransferase [Candidatus Krumholzibacteriota bacterium]|nr:glycosyltransferase [Candidatus Krumholzibacteriota bacterium]